MKNVQDVHIIWPFHDVDDPMRSSFLQTEKNTLNIFISC